MNQQSLRFHLHIAYKIENNRHLNHLKTLEWASLYHLLLAIRLRASCDAWSLPLDHTKYYSLKSLLEDLVVTADHSTNDLYNVIWCLVLASWSSTMEDAVYKFISFLVLYV